MQIELPDSLRATAAIESHYGGETASAVLAAMDAKQEYLIVSRHAAAVEFIRREDPRFAVAPLLTSATEDDVRGKIVAGNLPLRLAACAAEVVAVEFRGTPPRGTEYGIDEMRAAGATLDAYKIVNLFTPLYPGLRETIDSVCAMAMLVERKGADSGFRAGKNY